MPPGLFFHPACPVFCQNSYFNYLNKIWWLWHSLLPWESRVKANLAPPTTSMLNRCKSEPTPSGCLLSPPGFHCFDESCSGANSQPRGQVRGIKKIPDCSSVINIAFGACNVIPAHQTKSQQLHRAQLCQKGKHQSGKKRGVYLKYSRKT